jgi:hypothetical protein
MYEKNFYNFYLVIKTNWKEYIYYNLSKKGIKLILINALILIIIY